MGKFASRVGEALQSPQISPLQITVDSTQMQYKESTRRSALEVSPVMELENFSSMDVSVCHAGGCEKEPTVSILLPPASSLLESLYRQ